MRIALLGNAPCPIAGLAKATAAEPARKVLREKAMLFPPDAFLFFIQSINSTSRQRSYFYRGGNYVKCRLGDIRLRLRFDRSGPERKQKERDPGRIMLVLIIQ